MDTNDLNAHVIKMVTIDQPGKWQVIKETTLQALLLDRRMIFAANPPNSGKPYFQK